MRPERKQKISPDFAEEKMEYEYFIKPKSLEIHRMVREASACVEKEKIQRVFRFDRRGVSHYVWPITWELLASLRLQREEDPKLSFQAYSCLAGPGNTIAEHFFRDDGSKLPDSRQWRRRKP